MKNKLVILALGAEALICMAFAIYGNFSETLITDIFAFPFAQIGKTLRNMSLSSSQGNIAAITVYISICLLPCIVLLIILLVKKRRLYLEDILILLLSASLFFVIYRMINPDSMISYLNSENINKIKKEIFGISVYSIFFAYIIIRLLRAFFEAKIHKLHKYMIALLSILNILFVFIAFGLGVNSLVIATRNLSDNNTVNQDSLFMSKIFLVIESIIDYLPYVFDIIIIFTLIKLINELIKDRYSECAVKSAEKLSKLCSIMLVITILLNAVCNFLQVIFCKKLLVINSNLNTPLISIIVILLILILSRYISESKALKDDNDSFI